MYEVLGSNCIENKLPLTPALLIKASIEPKAVQARSTLAAMAGPSEVTSSCTAMARHGPPSIALIWSQRDLRRSVLRAAATTLQPALARSRQNSRPRPEEAPVTMTVLPERWDHGSNCCGISLAMFLFLSKSVWVLWWLWFWMVVFIESNMTMVSWSH